MGDRDWYLVIVSLVTLCPIGRDYAKGEVSRVDNDKYGGKPVTLSHECNYLQRVVRATRPSA